MDQSQRVGDLGAKVACTLVSEEPTSTSQSLPCSASAPAPADLHAAAGSGGEGDGGGFDVLTGANAAAGFGSP